MNCKIHLISVEKDKNKIKMRWDLSEKTLFIWSVILFLHSILFLGLYLHFIKIRGQCLFKPNGRIEHFNMARAFQPYAPNLDNQRLFKTHDNPELPFSIGERHFLMGGFCLQWGRTDQHRGDFEIPMDRTFIALATEGRATDEQENTVIRGFDNERVYTSGTKRFSYWVAIGMKITPLERKIL